MIEIKVRARPLYGGCVLMPANDAAKHLAAIAGTKSLTNETLARARLMGCAVEILDCTEFAARSDAAIDALAATIKERA
jgi:hypothetical protein